MPSVIVINDDTHFLTEMNNHSAKLVVVDFHATWCGPCKRIAPFFEQLPNKYPNAAFLKVDVDKCQDTAAIQGVSAMPTFIFYRNRVKVDRIQGADPSIIEQKINSYYGSGNVSSGDTECSVPGYMNLSTFLFKNQCEALNESDDHTLQEFLEKSDAYLESDCDAQLILNFSFNQAVKVHSIKIKAPADSGPKVLKIFINQPTTLDFDSASDNTATQEIELTKSDLEGLPVNLRFVKFQNVQNLQIFVKDNQEGSDITRIDELEIIGIPVATTNMQDFKRIAGKKGEAH